MPFVIRQNNPTEGTTTFHDEIYGDITVDNSELDDMVLIKSDGYPTYNFANVVDDHLMEHHPCGPRERVPVFFTEVQPSVRRIRLGGSGLCTLPD